LVKNNDHNKNNKILPNRFSPQYLADPKYFAQAPIKTARRWFASFQEEVATEHYELISLARACLKTC
jgi:hypothetical protein